MQRATERATKKMCSVSGLGAQSKHIATKIITIVLRINEQGSNHPACLAPISHAVHAQKKKANGTVRAAPGKSRRTAHDIAVAKTRDEASSAVTICTKDVSRGWRGAKYTSFMAIIDILKISVWG
jgi:hypothetical protein